MRVLTLLLFLTVIVLISNASPPKKRRAKTAVGTQKRLFKSAPGRQNSAAARAFSSPKSAKNKQLKKATGANNRSSLRKHLGTGSSNNGKARRAAAAKSRVGSKRSRPKPAYNKRRGAGSSSRNRPANRTPFPTIPDDTLFDDEQYLDELPDNDLSFDMPEYKDSPGNNRRGQKTTSNRTFGGSNDELFDDDLTLDDDIFGNITDYDDLSDIAGKYNASTDEIFKGLNLDDDEENGGKTNGDVSDPEKCELKGEKCIADLNDAQFNELLENIGVELDSAEDIDGVADGAQKVEEDKKTEVDKVAESGSEKSSVEKNIDYNDEKDDIDSDETVADEGSEEVEKSSGESNSTQPTGKISDEKDYDFEDLIEEELPEGDYEEYDEDDDKKL